MTFERLEVLDQDCQPLAILKRHEDDQGTLFSYELAEKHQNYLDKEIKRKVREQGGEILEEASLWCPGSAALLSSLLMRFVVFKDESGKHLDQSELLDWLKSKDRE